VRNTLDDCAQKTQNIIDIFRNITGICKNITGICRNINDILSFLCAVADFLLPRRRLSPAPSAGFVGGCGGFQLRMCRVSGAVNFLFSGSYKKKECGRRGRTLSV
jgi:hypothetical protein